MIPSRGNSWDAVGPASSSARSAWYLDGALPQHISAFPNHRYDMLPGTGYQPVHSNSLMPDFRPPLPTARAWHQQLGGLAPQPGSSQLQVPNAAMQDPELPVMTEQSSKRRRPARRGLPWDDHKQTMHDHYIGQNKTLKELRSYMTETHRFDATLVYQRFLI
jgi:hypothetical protein